MQTEWARAYKHERKALHVAVIDLDVGQIPISKGEKGAKLDKSYSRASRVRR